MSEKVYPSDMSDAQWKIIGPLDSSRQAGRPTS